jgi:hypothetical protein
MILVAGGQETFLRLVRLKDLFRTLKAAAVSHLDGPLSFLTKADRHSWELPTSQVQLLVGAKPRGTTFARYGFTFRPAGKHGQETSWRVER